MGPDGDWGVSVVIPAARGAAALAVTMASLADQTLAAERFEVVVVVNGRAAADRGYGSVRESFPGLTIRFIVTTTPGASFAWNLGVQSARMEWLTFVDDDDTVAPPFLETLLAAARPGVVPVTEIHDVHPDGAVVESTPLNRRIRGLAGTTVPAARFPQAFGFNAAKLVPTRWAKECRFDTDLTNGQDIGFFGTLSLRHDITLAVPVGSARAAYQRGVSDTSMSRQAMSYDFSIEQRLGVITALDRGRRGSPRRRRAVADHLLGAQVHMMNRFLVIHPERRGDALGAIRRRRLSTFPYPSLNRDLATALVVTDGSPASGRAIRSWAASRTEPFDVLLVAEPAADAGLGRPGGWGELEGRCIRATAGGAAALAALDQAFGPRLPYREVSAGDRTARRIAREIVARHPDVRLASPRWSAMRRRVAS